MPYVCCVPNCRENYPTGPKVNVFGFPQDESLQKKWIHATRRENFTPSKTSKVSSFALFESLIMVEDYHNV